MTDNEIIKALECCKAGRCVSGECAFYSESKSVEECMDELVNHSFDLINRQKAEIEGLKKQNSISQHLLSEAWHSIEEKDKFCENAKSEAIREFAERLKNVALPIKIGGKYEYEVVTKQAIDHFVKEMTEGENG